MYNGLLMAHSGWRYIVLVLLLVAIIKYLIGWLGNGKWSSFDDMLNRFTPISVDIQWLLGLIVWILATWWNNGDRARAWEHPITMTLAVVAVHLLAMRVKKAPTDKGKFLAGLMAYLVTLAVIALGLFVITGGWNLFA
jgi:hypothetical protein